MPNVYTRHWPEKNAKKKYGSSINLIEPLGSQTFISFVLLSLLHRILTEVHKLNAKQNVLQFIKTLYLAVRGAIVEKDGTVSAFVNLDFSLQVSRKAFSDLSSVRDQLSSTLHLV